MTSWKMGECWTEGAIPAYLPKPVFTVFNVNGGQKLKSGGISGKGMRRAESNSRAYEKLYMMKC